MFRTDTRDDWATVNFPVGPLNKVRWHECRCIDSNEEFIEMLNDIDPDVNYYNGFQQSIDKCKYYIEDVFNKEVSKNSTGEWTIGEWTVLKAPDTGCHNSIIFEAHQ